MAHGLPENARKLWGYTEADSTDQAWDRFLPHVRGKPRAKDVGRWYAGNGRTLAILS